MKPLSEIPAERWNAMQAALLMHRDRVPFHVRAEAIEAAERVVQHWEDFQEQWCAAMAEIERLRAFKARVLDEVDPVHLPWLAYVADNFDLRQTP